MPVPLLVKLTVPVGDDLLPEAVSWTVALQLVEPPTSTVEGVHVTEVLVLRRTSVNVVCAVQLDAWPVAVARNRTPTSERSGLV